MEYKLHKVSFQLCSFLIKFPILSKLPDGQYVLKEGMTNNKGGNEGGKGERKGKKGTFIYHEYSKIPLVYF